MQVTRRAKPLTGNLARQLQGVSRPMVARVPIVKFTPHVVPKGPGNMQSPNRSAPKMAAHGR
jgi:hypothetical protein